MRYVFRSSPRVMLRSGSNRISLPYGISDLLGLRDLLYAVHNPHRWSQEPDTCFWISVPSWIQYPSEASIRDNDWVSSWLCSWFAMSLEDMWAVRWDGNVTHEKVSDLVVSSCALPLSELWMKIYAFTTHAADLKRVEGFSYDCRIAEDVFWW